VLNGVKKKGGEPSLSFFLLSQNRGGEMERKQGSLLLLYDRKKEGGEGVFFPLVRRESRKREKKPKFLSSLLEGKGG